MSTVEDVYNGIRFLRQSEASDKQTEHTGIVKAESVVFMRAFRGVKQAPVAHDRCTEPIDQIFNLGGRGHVSTSLVIVERYGHAYRRTGGEYSLPIVLAFSGQLGHQLHGFSARNGSAI